MKASTKRTAQRFGMARTLAIRGDRLVVARGKAKLSQGELAKLVGVSQPTISLWERGLKQPHADALVWALADALGVKVTTISQKAAKAA